MLAPFLEAAARDQAGEDGGGGQEEVHTRLARLYLERIAAAADAAGGSPEAGLSALEGGATGAAAAARGGGGGGGRGSGSCATTAWRGRFRFLLAASHSVRSPPHPASPLPPPSL
jgi:hypothetical protein